MKHLLLICNPKSGRGLSTERLLDMLRFYEAKHYLVSVYLTKKNDKLADVLPLLEEDWKLVCCGGDGMVNLLVNGLARAGLSQSFGYIPAGTTNDFAKSVGLPVSLDTQLAASISRQKLALDLGCMRFLPAEEETEAKQPAPEVPSDVRECRTSAADPSAAVRAEDKTLPPEAESAPLRPARIIPMTCAPLRQPKTYDRQAFPAFSDGETGRSFLYVAGFGLFTDVSYKTPQSSKNAFGYLAYVLEGIKSISEIRSLRLRVTADGEVIEGEFILGLVTNSMSVAGMKAIGQSEIQLDDGRFEMLLIRRSENLAQLSELLAGIVTGDMKSPLIVYRHCTDFLFEGDSLSWTVDGEFGGTSERTEIRVEQGRIAVRI